MTDATALQDLIDPTLRNNAALKAEFPNGAVKLYDVPPTNAKDSYIVLGEDAFASLPGEQMDLKTATVTIHVWSKTDPPGKKKAKAIGGKIVTALLALERGALVKTAELTIERYFMDTDSVTCHGVIVVELALQSA